MSRMSTLTIPAQTTAISTLGYNAKRLRLQSDRTQSDVAASMSELDSFRGNSAVSLRVQIASIENGRAPAGSSMEWLDAFAAVFEVAFDELLRDPPDL